MGHRPHLYIPTIQKILFVGHVLDHHFHVRIEDFTGVAVLHQSILPLEQTFFGFLLQLLVGLENKLHSIATIRPSQLIPKHFGRCLAIYRG